METRQLSGATTSSESGIICAQDHNLLTCVIVACRYRGLTTQAYVHTATTANSRSKATYWTALLCILHGGGQGGLHS